MPEINPTLVLAVLAALVFLGMGLEEVFRRTGIPDVLVLLLIGFAASVSGVVDLSAFKGIDKIFTTTALVLILFEGALRIRLDDLRTALGRSLVLTLTSFALWTGILTALGITLFGMRPLAAVAFGCILGGTSSAVVIPMVQNLVLNRDTKTVLTLESALSDVLCIVFTLAITSALTAGSVSWTVVGQDLARGFGTALLIGGVLGFAWAVWLRTLRKKRPSMLFLGAAVFLVYAIAEALGSFGAIACLSFGIVLGNAHLFARGRKNREELSIFEGEKFFLSEMAFLLKVFFFVYLGASLQLSGYEPIVFGGLATVMIFASRPFAVRLSLSKKTTPRRDATIASVLAPKGLAAAVLATVPAQAGVAEGKTIEAITFGVVLFSITASSALVLFARRPFVANAFAVFFKGYAGVEEQTPAAQPEQPPAALPEPAVQPAPAETTAAADKTPEAAA